MMKFRKFGKAKEGVAATEFALIAPVMITLVLGVFDYCMFLNATMQLQITARSAAQYVLNGGDVSGLQNNIIAPSTVANSGVTVTTSYVCLCDDGDQSDCSSACENNTYRRKFIDITLGMTYNSPVTFPGLPSSIPLNSHARLQME
jgi:Flp pilus assembly protein TadG